MSKEVNCYQCGFDYPRKNYIGCPRCGEARIFIPEKDDPNYDLLKDPARYSKLKVVAALVMTFLSAVAIIVLGK